jgi:TRAP-type C4-dicarboxylate transport system permease small subunit
LTETDSKPGLLARFERVGQLIENTTLAVILSGMILLAAGQIVLRNFVGSGLPWADEALRLMVLWVAMLGAVAASREDRHISIDVLSRLLPERFRGWVAALVHATTAAVSMTLAWFSWVFVSESRDYQETLLGDMPAWVFQVILPVAFFLIGYRYFIWFLRDLRPGTKMPAEES